MQWSLFPRRVGAPAFVGGVLVTLSACAPQSGVSRSNETAATPEIVETVSVAAAEPPAASSPIVFHASAAAPPSKPRAAASQQPKTVTAPPTKKTAAKNPPPVTSRNTPPTGKAAVSSRQVAAPVPTGPPPWPQFRGPERDGVSPETGLLKQWTAGGPPLLWKRAGLGTGNSAPSVAAGRIHGMSYRGEDEVVWALEEATGKPLWSTRIAAANRDIGPQAHDGPGCTPTVVGDRIYASGASGDVVCLQVSDGKLLWRKNLVRDFGGAVPQWGYAESPLVDGNKVIVTPGGGDATLVALNRMTGATIWKGKVPQGDGAAYSSAITAEVAGQRQIIQFLAKGVVGMSAADGRFLWRYDSPANNFGINCSTPVFHQGQVFAASAYNNGGGLAKLSGGAGGAVTATEVYRTRNMRNQHGGMVVVNGYLYGFDESNLTCLDFKTGDVKWSERSVGKGSVTYADGHLYARSERGPVALVEASPERYIEKGRFEQTDRSGKTTWPYPVVASGRLYLRDHDNLLCYSVKAGGK